MRRGGIGRVEGWGGGRGPVLWSSLLVFRRNLVFVKIGIIYRYVR